MPPSVTAGNRVSKHPWPRSHHWPLRGFAESSFRVRRQGFSKELACYNAPARLHPLHALLQADRRSKPMSERSFPRGSFGFKGTREPDPGNQSPDSSGRYAENHRAFGLAFAGRQQFPYSDDGPAVQFRRSATYLARSNEDSGCPDSPMVVLGRIRRWWAFEL